MERRGQKEKEVELRRWSVDRGITRAVFDMDGTMVKTDEHFTDGMRVYCEYLDRENEKKNNTEEMGLFSLFGGDLLKSLRDEFHVHPALLDVSARILAKMCEVEGPGLEKEMDKLMMIYETVPEVYPGAANEVRLIRNAGMDTAVMTQAAEIWNGMKKKYFIGLFRDYICTPTDKPKDFEAWMVGMEKINARPAETMIVGDSWEGDILPALEMGAGVVVWVRNGRPSKNDDRVIEIDNIADLTDALLMN